MRNRYEFGDTSIRDRRLLETSDFLIANPDRIDHVNAVDEALADYFEDDEVVSVINHDETGLVAMGASGNSLGYRDDNGFPHDISAAFGDTPDDTAKAIVRALRGER